MSRNLDRARELLENCTVAIVGESGEYTSCDRGVKALLSLQSDNTLNGASVADKIVGKAAAFLLVRGRVSEVYAEVISASGAEVLKAHNIPFKFGKLTDCIVNRAGTGMCPMEEAVKDICDPDEAYFALSEKVRKTVTGGAK